VPSHIPSDSTSLSASLMRRHHFFVSYSGVEYENAQAITEVLQQHGLRVFMDRDAGRFDRAPRRAGDPRGTPIPGSSDIIGQALWEELVHSLGLLLIATRRSYCSSWVAQEFRLFNCQRKPIFVWHPDGDFWQSPPYVEGEYAFDRTEYQAVAGDVEVPWILQHIPETRQELGQVARRLLLWLDLMEFAEWHGAGLSCDSIESQAQERNACLLKYRELQEEHVRRYGMELSITRKPNQHTDGMPARRGGKHRPFLLKAIELLEKRIAPDD
jgi:hypothetical protein